MTGSVPLPTSVAGQEDGIRRPVRSRYGLVQHRVGSRGYPLTDELPRRAASMVEYRELGRLLGEVADFAVATGWFRPRADDVIIAPFAKCGTTWLQQIFHCLRTGGDMDFDDI